MRIHWSSQPMRVYWSSQPMRVYWSSQPMRVYWSSQTTKVYWSSQTTRVQPTRRWLASTWSTVSWGQIFTAPCRNTDLLGRRPAPAPPPGADAVSSRSGRTGPPARGPPPRGHRGSGADSLQTRSDPEAGGGATARESGNIGERFGSIWSRCLFLDR
ncbi:hypothetical protein EYF80_056184 [Liparis tanakae]|uniref:Uncharacterized protein n=1 Tax=Liparis tanakae TaxID=230148 RepID=A0A4Z2EZ56_9TELE|nr:hypothetical protein EYF80_056184 [Liparis tanakae]